MMFFSVSERIFHYFQDTCNSISNLVVPNGFYHTLWALVNVSGV